MFCPQSSFWQQRSLSSKKSVRCCSECCGFLCSGDEWCTSSSVTQWFWNVCCISIATHWCLCGVSSMNLMFHLLWVSLSPVLPACLNSGQCCSRSVNAEGSRPFAFSCRGGWELMCSRHLISTSPCWRQWVKEGSALRRRICRPGGVARLQHYPAVSSLLWDGVPGEGPASPTQWDLLWSDMLMVNACFHLLKLSALPSRILWYHSRKSCFKRTCPWLLCAWWVLRALGAPPPGLGSDGPESFSEVNTSSPTEPATRAVTVRILPRLVAGGSPAWKGVL